MIDYIKQTWVDRETPVDAEHLNHIEDGIHANSEALSQNAERIDQLSEEIVDLKSEIGFADFALLGHTPQTLTAEGRVKLVTPETAEYQILSPTVADFAQDELTFASCNMTYANGCYEIRLTDEITAFYQAYVDWRVTGLTPGETYRLYLECNDDKYNPSTMTIFPDGVTTPILGSYDAKSSMWETLETSFAEFTPTTDAVNVRVYVVHGDRDGSDSAQWLEKSVNKFKNIYVNRADAGSAFTEIVNKSGVITGSAVFERVPAGSTISSTPACDVYYAVQEAETVIRISRHHGKICVCFGDSITGNMSAPNDYPTVLANETGMTVINGGFGGCRMGRHTAEAYDAFSMYRLADAVANGDWTLQQTQIENITSANRHAHLDALMGVDWSKVDFITIAYGTNDITGGNAIDNENNPKDTTTFIGALRYSIESILTAYPHIKMLLLTPTYRYWIDEDNVDSDAKRFDGKAYTEWGDALLKAANDYKIPAVDMYRTLGFNALTRGYYFPATDGTHPNANGQKVIGGKVAARLLAEY